MELSRPAPTTEPSRIFISQELRAMDRRRFAPATEGLEKRELLATTPNFTNVFGFQVSPNLNIPITFQQKELRVERLPFYLGKIRPGRFLPKTEIQQVQADLFQLISKLHKPSSTALDFYNQQLRQVVPHESLTPTDASVLKNIFGTVLKAAAVSPATIDSLKSSLNTLVTQIDTASPQPVYLATNDYSLVLQTALSIGRPMPAPILPKIAKNQGIQANVNHIKTTLRHPALVGTYHFHTHIQIITSSGEVVGLTNVRKDNRYKVLVTPPLSPGVYQFRIRAYDDGGNPSRVSRLFEIKVVPRRHHAAPAK
jgi:hypothetical protein